MIIPPTTQSLPFPEQPIVCHSPPIKALFLVSGSGILRAGSDISLVTIQSCRGLLCMYLYIAETTTAHYVSLSNTASEKRRLSSPTSAVFREIKLNTWNAKLLSLPLHHLLYLIASEALRRKVVLMGEGVRASSILDSTIDRCS